MTYVFKSQMLFVLWDLVGELFDGKSFVHFFELLDLAVRETALPKILVLFLFPAQICDWLATLSCDSHVDRPTATSIARIRRRQEVPDSTHDSVALRLRSRPCL